MSGTNAKKTLIAEGPAIVLVEPQLGENIGMVARAMANFGLAKLRLVNPRDGWPSERARAVASRADHVIDAASVHSSLADAIADLQFVYATSARPREMIKQVSGPAEAAQNLRKLHQHHIKAGLLFGRERWGLENDEVALCDGIVTFPVNPAFASLNIAQAVLLMAYEWMKTAQVPMPPSEPIIPAVKEEVIGLIDHVVSALDEARYFYLAEKRERMTVALNSMLSRPGYTLEEVRTLRGVVSALQRRWQRKTGQIEE